MNKLDAMIESASGPIAEQSTRDSIMALEDQLKEMPQIEIPVIHRYSGGIYTREITIPAGVMLTGKIYLDDHFDVMVHGDITVTSDEGRKRLTGFNIFKGKKGKKRAGYAHADTRWLTFCACPEMPDDEYIDYLTTEDFKDLELDWIEETDIKNIFKAQSSYKWADYPAFMAGYLLASDKKLKTDVDREDYALALAESGFTEAVVRAQIEATDDMIELDHDYGVSIKGSPIEGKGLFSDRFFSAGDTIMPARVHGMRTIAGRYPNHAVSPNAKIVMRDGDIYLVAIKDIGHEEITRDYRANLSLKIERVK